jgi:hypothetical protein
MAGGRCVVEHYDARLGLFCLPSAISVAGLPSGSD